MQNRPLGRTGLAIAPLVFGGNVFGWTADRAASFALLDALVDSGFNAIDTADFYSRWLPGHEGGESERMIGAWLAANPGKRDKLVLMTKLGMDMGPGRSGLSARWIEQAVDESLRRLRTDVIDLYQAHCFDPDTPQAETLEAFGRLIAAGKVRAIGCSNFSADQLSAALDTARQTGLPAYGVIQPRYNLLVRDAFEGPLRALAEAEGLGVIAFSALAGGFLTGKYRTAADLAAQARGDIVARYLDARGLAVVDAVGAIAARRGLTSAQIALAWVLAQRGVTAPIVSARNVAQWEGLRRATEIVLDADELAELDRVSA